MQNGSNGTNGYDPFHQNNIIDHEIETPNKLNTQSTVDKLIEQNRVHHESQVAGLIAPVKEAPTIELCLRRFIRNKGKMELTAEDLDISVEELALLFVRHKTELYEAIEAISLLSAFDNFAFAGTLMKGALGSMAASDNLDGAVGISKAYTNMLEIIRTMTSPKSQGVGGTNVFMGQNNFNVDQAILEKLTPIEREAMKVLAQHDNDN